jgi:broad specificity phosphatase PhoE
MLRTTGKRFPFEVLYLVLSYALKYCLAKNGKWDHDNMMTKKDITLIRHAESQANAGAVTLTPKSIELTERGHQQAKSLAASLDITPALIVVSPYVRAQQTAQPTIEKFPEALVEQWSVQEFTYLSPARCRNTTMKHRTPWAAEYWERADPHYRDGAGAESFAMFLGRVQDFTAQLSSRTESPILVFTHQMFIAACLWLRDHTPHDPLRSMQSFREYLLANVIPNAGMVCDSDFR